VNPKLFGEVFVTLLVIVDPPGMVPVFLALTGALPARQRIRAGTQAVLLIADAVASFVELYTAA
jgi:multiple antibiotic resistance protein